MKWTNKNAHHVGFGVVKTDGEKISSRLGNTPKLIDLITKGVEYTTKSFEKKESGIGNNIVAITDIAVSSIKYFDLSKCRTSDYDFNFERMLRSDGNTFTYLTYVLARCRGVGDNLNNNNCVLPEFLDQTQQDDLDYLLLRKICEFPAVINEVINDNKPNYLCNYIYELATCFHENYTKTRCINFDESGVLLNYNSSKFACYLMVHSTIEQSFKLLGLKIVDKI
jgi:arginyl-tRNA synthetase